MQPMAASVCTAISASSMRRARTTWKPILSMATDDLVEPLAFERLGIEGRRAEQEGEAPEEVHGMRSVATRIDGVCCWIRR